MLVNMNFWLAEMFYQEKPSWKNLQQDCIFTLGKELKAQTDIANKQYEKLDNLHGFDKIINKRKTNIYKM